MSPRKRRSDLPDDFFHVDREWDESVREDLLSRKRFRNSLAIEPGVTDLSFLETLDGIRRISIHTTVRSLEPILAHQDFEYIDFCFGHAPGKADWGRLPNLWRLDFNCVDGAESLREHPTVEDLQGHVGSDIQWLATMDKIEQVNLHGRTKGVTIDVGPVGGIPTLRDFGIGDWAYVNGDLSWIRDMPPPGLFSLQLSFRRGTVVDLSPLTHFRHLKYLHLEGRGVRYKNAEDLTSLPELEWVTGRGLGRSVEEFFAERMAVKET